MYRIYMKVVNLNRTQITATLKFYGHTNTLLIEIYPEGYWTNMLNYKYLKICCDKYNHGEDFVTYAQGQTLNDRIISSLLWLDSFG